MEVDVIYYEEGMNQLAYDGQIHLHLLLAKELGLKRISYEWGGMPIVDARRESSVVKKIGTGTGHRSGGGPRKAQVWTTQHGKVKKVRQIQKGHGNRLKTEVGRRVDMKKPESEEEDSPPSLVLIDEV